MSLPDQSVTWMPCLYYFARFFSPIFLWFRNEDRKRDSIRPWRNICQLCISRIETWTTTGKMGRNLTYGKLWIGEERWKLSTLFSLWPTFFVTFCLFPGSGALQNGEQGVAIVHLGNLLMRIFQAAEANRVFQERQIIVCQASCASMFFFVFSSHACGQLVIIYSLSGLSGFDSAVDIEPCLDIGLVRGWRGK